MQVCLQNEDDAEVNNKGVGSDGYFNTVAVHGNKSSGARTESPGQKNSSVCCVLVSLVLYVSPRTFIFLDR